MALLQAGFVRGRVSPSIAPRSAVPPSAALGRMAWIDVAKGGSIMLVVLMHVASWFAVNVDTDGARLWTMFSAVSAPIRMPLFFFVSGFLAVGALGKPLCASFCKTVGLFALYLFWTALFLARTWHPALRGGLPAPALHDYLASLILPTVFWYIWALPVFYLITWLAHRFLKQASVLLIIPAAVLALAYAPIMASTAGMFRPPLAPVMIDSVTSNFIWFIAGLHLRDAWLQLVRDASARRALLGGMAYMLIIGLSLCSGIDAKAMKLLAAPVALFTCAQMFGLCRFDGPIAVAFAHVGRMTLPVYIFHIFGIAVLSALFKISGLDLRLRATDPAIGAIVIPALSLALVAASRSAGEILSRSPLKWLVVPIRLSGNLERQNSAAPANRYLPLRQRSEQ